MSDNKKNTIEKKRLGGKIKRTSVAVLKIGAADLLLITGFTAAAAVFVIFKYFV